MSWQLRVEGPIGPLLVVSDEDAVYELTFDAAPRPGLPLGDPLGAGAALAAYFAGELGALEALPARPTGTAWEARVWALLRKVPPGETRSYGELARSLDRPGAARAVGLANGRNPVALVIPCHRVVGADGRLVGYGGGLDRKRWLLAHEGAPGYLVP